MLVASIFSFSHMVFYPSNTWINFCAIFKLTFATAFNLKNFVVWYCVQGSMLYLTTKFSTSVYSRKVESIVAVTKLSWLVVLGLNATLTAKVISWQSVTHVFSDFLTPVLTQLFFAKPPTTFLTCFCRSNSNHQVRSPTLTNEPPGWGTKLRAFEKIVGKRRKCQ